MNNPFIPEQFCSALYKGLGRAVLHVRKYGDEQIRKHLLDACVHVRSYDPQIEGSRAEWLLEMVDATSHGDFYREAILDALEVVEEGAVDAVWSADQLCDFALHYARRGHQRGRELLYQVYRENRFSEADWVAADQLLSLDGLDGLTFMAEVAGERILAGDRVDQWDAAVPTACEEFGSVQVLARLQEASAQSLGVSAFLEQFAEALPRRDKGADVTGIRRKVPSYEVISQAIDEARWQVGFQFRWFGRHASAEELCAIFDRLLGEQELEAALRCLWVFDSRELPELAPRVFEWLDSDDERLRTAAASALANTSDSRVRQAAVDRLEEPSSTTDLAAAIEMLRRNFRTDDADLILRCLPNDESISDEAKTRNHSLGSVLLELAENNADAALAPCLTWVYEKGPCSRCRTRAIEHLLEWGELSDKLRDECRFDVVEEIRELVV
ncbi:HEAT repeat domain-containing protein [Persicimonas caeni]|uniref:HEAT repeat domain-containing protein n=1 Tax=Persicimonas caeni TaxID=2292766 RepID=A0A4Y6PXP1_PERCE|nr:HEAT repeat domain-containing protein [Persicimonas caeni]QDG53091.1 HEAT repeat domain-containing protein [Persicimonas caeni]QED34313.1 HEAT repeat domain-containing protein [Persicimonas caeni]